MSDLEQHRSVSLDLLRSTSAFAVRTPRGQKDPGVVQWDPKNNTREKSNQTIKLLETSHDNLGIHLFGAVVDVDVDTDNPSMIAALDHFLPPTAHVWGRRSRPRTHRLYELAGDAAFDPAAYTFLSKVQSNPLTAIEVRGGAQKSGRYSLLPGSVHPSGEHYEWEDLARAHSTPAQVPVARLMDGARLACVAALIAPSWVEGSRNELCKALCGFMFRAAQFSAELDDSAPFDRDAALRLLEGIMDIADDREDHFMRVKTFDQTWEKGAAGQPIVGANRLAELLGDPSIIPLLYSLLANTPDAQQLEEMFSRYALVRNTTSVVDLSMGARGAYIMNKDAFMTMMMNKYIATASGRANMGAVFFHSRQRPEVDHVSMDPAQDKVYVDGDGLRCANIWGGWAIPPYEGDFPDSDVEPFIDYLMRVVCRGDQPTYDWVLQWLADIFQNPASKPGTALVLVGEQGAGKSFLCENVMRPIIGNAHFAKVSTTEKLTSKFNSHMGGKLLIQGEEVLNSNRKVDSDALKDMITSSIRSIEFKGRDVVEMVDHARYVLTSNNIDNAVHVGKGDRRSTIIHVSSEYAYLEGKNEDKRREFFGRLFGWAETVDDEGRVVPHRDNLAKLHAYLLRVKIDRAVIRVAHMTAIKRMTRLNSTRGIDAWLLSMIEMDHPFENMRDPERAESAAFSRDAGNRWVLADGWPEYVKYSMLETSLKQFVARDYGEQRSAQQIAKFFKDNGMLEDTQVLSIRFGGKVHQPRPFPTRRAVRNYLTASGYEILDDATGEAHDGSDSSPGF